jgi:hypothetical protein
MRDVELRSGDNVTYGWVICIQNGKEVLGFVGPNGVIFDHVENAVRYQTKSDAILYTPKTLGQAMACLAEANGTTILEELAEVSLGHVLGLFQIKELRVVV